mgnify:CR=1 FL=1
MCHKFGHSKTKKQIMKKTTLFGIVFSLMGLGVNAQSFVSTNPENKNVLIEEYTGIKCGWCPAGHKIAHEIDSTYPGDVVQVNIHTGTYATPTSSNHPDFRTEFGASYASLAGVSSFPQAAINRHEFTGGKMAMSRSLWNQYSSQILAQPSYVNIAAQSTVDLTSRKITVNVEAYYTGNSPVSTNKLNVFLLQSNIAEYQNGSSKNPADVLSNGDYNHKHMLRHAITGLWGDEITTTTSGSFISKTYTYDVPCELNGVDYDLQNLEVIVFIAEDNAEVITANKSTMSFISMQPGQQIVDLGVTSNTTVADLCVESIIPEVTVSNTGNMAVDSFDVSYTMNGATVTETINSLLNPNSSITHQFSSVSTIPGINTLSYNVSVGNYFSFVDTICPNNYDASSFNVVLPSNNGVNITEDFDAYTLGEVDVNGIIISNPDNQRLYVVDQSLSSNVNWDLGGFGNSSSSLRFDMYSWALNSVASITLEKVDLTNTQNPTIDFSYATTGVSSGSTEFNYGQFKVYVSSDCGVSWDVLFDKTGAALQTADVVEYVSGVGGRFYPQANEWKAESLSLSAYQTEQEVIIKFEGLINNGGNSLYLDDIKLSGSTSSSIEDNLNSYLKLYPNPASEILNINLKELDLKELYIMDVIGNIVDVLFVEGKNIQYDVSNYEPGIYLISSSGQKLDILSKLIVY